MTLPKRFEELLEEAREAGNSPELKSYIPCPGCNPEHPDFKASKKPKLINTSDGKVCATCKGNQWTTALLNASERLRVLGPSGGKFEQVRQQRMPTASIVTAEHNHEETADYTERKTINQPLINGVNNFMTNWAQTVGVRAPAMMFDSPVEQKVHKCGPGCSHGVPQGQHIHGPDCGHAPSLIVPSNAGSGQTPVFSSKRASNPLMQLVEALESLLCGNCGMKCSVMVNGQPMCSPGEGCQSNQNSLQPTTSWGHENSSNFMGTGESLAEILRHDKGHDDWHRSMGQEPCTSDEDCAAKKAEHKSMQHEQHSGPLGVISSWVVTADDNGDNSDFDDSEGSLGQETSSYEADDEE